MGLVILPLLLLTTLGLAQKPAFPLKVSLSKRYLVDGQGKAFLYQANTGWQLFARLTLAEVREYLALCQQQGFTAIKVMLSVNLDSANHKGEKLYKDYDFSHPNKAYFSPRRCRDWGN